MRVALKTPSALTQHDVLAYASRNATAAAGSCMPLVRLFAHKALTKAIPLPKLQARLCEIWGVKPQTMKLLLTRVDDWTSDQFDEGGTVTCC